MADIGAVAKGRKNEQQGYMFRGIEDMYQAAHPALVKHKVFCCPQVTESDSQDRVMKNGTPAVRVTLKVAHRFYAPDGSYVEVITCGEGIDTSDKATNKAMSAAMKYAFIELFSIPTQDVEDSDKASPEAGLTGRGAVAETVTLARPVKVPEQQQPALPDFSSQEFITVHQSSHLSRRFRESLRPELEPEANELRHKALLEFQKSGLYRSKFVDGDGNPTQAMILAGEYDSIGKALVKFAKTL